MSYILSPTKLCKNLEMIEITSADNDMGYPFDLAILLRGLILKKYFTHSQNYAENSS